MDSNTISVSLSWSRSDPECKLGLTGARFTKVRSPLCALFGVVITLTIYGILALLPPQCQRIVDFFSARGPTPYVIVFAAAWCIVLLVIKSRKLALQRRALEYTVVPQFNDFVLSPVTASAWSVHR